MSALESILLPLSSSTTFAWFSAGPQEMLIIGVIALLLFGKRLPEVARNLGRGLSEFKKGMQGFEDEVRKSSNSSGSGSSSTYTGSNTSSSANRPTAESAAPAEGEDEFTAPRFEIQD
ncbi:MAG: twin-arginine translocase TatA/TatE family subunit [Planctomycetaceae bacterium]|nr:twin-arginine translocase TatA/TatE family subunit [Planctomycetaceae bacterium]